MSIKENNVCAEKTFKQLFKSYSKPIRNFLIYRGSDSEQANDLVQEAFIKLWENCKKVVPEKAKSYLYTLASNAFLNEIEHSKVKLKYSNSAHVSTGITLETPEFKLEEEEFRERLERAISELTANQRDVFLMNRIDKMTYGEIAESLELSVKAIEKRMSKALKELRSKIIELK